MGGDGRPGEGKCSGQQLQQADRRLEGGRAGQVERLDMKDAACQKFPFCLAMQIVHTTKHRTCGTPGSHVISCSSRVQPWPRRREGERPAPTWPRLPGLRCAQVWNAAIFSSTLRAASWSPHSTCAGRR